MPLGDILLQRGQGLGPVGNVLFLCGNVLLQLGLELCAFLLPVQFLPVCAQLMGKFLCGSGKGLGESPGTVAQQSGCLFVQLPVHGIQTAAETAEGGGIVDALLMGWGREAVISAGIA